VAASGRGRPSVRLRRVGFVAEVVLDRPDALNAISTQVARDLARACGRLDADPRVRAVVVSSACDRAFCVGADLKERAGMRAGELVAQRPTMRAAFEAVRAIAVPTIAAVAGHALGGGFELALSCDLVVADDSASFGLPEVRVGLVPAGGGTQLLARRVGIGVAAELVFTGRRVGIDEAWRLGLVDRRAPAGEARAVALALAEEIAANSPNALRAAKRALRLGAGAALEVGLEIEDGAWRSVVASGDAAEGIAAFVARRAPSWQSSPDGAG